MNRLLLVDFFKRLSDSSNQSRVFGAVTQIIKTVLTRFFINQSRAFNDSANRAQSAIGKVFAEKPIMLWNPDLSQCKNLLFFLLLHFFALEVIASRKYALLSLEAQIVLPNHSIQTHSRDTAQAGHTCQFIRRRYWCALSSLASFSGYKNSSIILRCSVKVSMKCIFKRLRNNFYHSWRAVTVVCGLIKLLLKTYTTCYGHRFFEWKLVSEDLQSILFCSAWL